MSYSRRGADLKRVTRLGVSDACAARGLGPADLIPLVWREDSVGMKDYRGRTALFSSAESARIETTRILMDSGSDPDA